MLFIIRHGTRMDRSTYENQKTVKFPTDPKLSQIGKNQAFLTGEKIKNMIPNNSKIIIMTSPYIRCLQTTENIIIGLNEKKKLIKKNIFVEDALRECVFHKEIKKRYKKIYFFREKYSFREKKIDYNKKLFHLKLNLQKKIENHFDKAKRAFDCIDDCFDQIKEDSNLVIILISHSFFHRAIEEVFFQSYETVVNSCATSLIVVGKKGKMKLVGFNEQYYI